MSAARLVLCILLTVVASSITAFAQTGFTKHVYPAVNDHMLTADFNHDGEIDLLLYGGYTTNGELQSSTIRFNEGVGDFTRSLSLPAFTAVAITDLNRDGYPDIVACTAHQSAGQWITSVDIYLNQSGVSFNPIQSVPIAPGSCAGITAGDVNRDGHQDIVVGRCCANQPGDSILTFFGDGTGHLGAPVVQSVNVYKDDPYTQGYLAAITGADFKGTGNFDLLLLGRGDNGTTYVGTLYYATSTGDGHYTLNYLGDGNRVPQDFPRVTDVNHDLRPDVITTIAGAGPHNDWWYALVLANNGDGTFAITGLAPSGSDAFLGPFIESEAAADFDGDSIIDLMVAAFDSSDPSHHPGLVFFKGQGNNTWAEGEHTDFPAEAVALIAADFNNDNRSDFALITGGELQIFLNSQSYTVSSCLPDRAGVHICSPGNATYSSVVRVKATGSGISGAVRLMHLYVDGKKVSDYPGSVLDTVLSLSAGQHSLVVSELEYNGQSTKSAPVSFTVSATCSAPAAYDIHVCSPINGSIVTGPSVPINATARMSGTIYRFELWVDGVKKVSIAASATMTTSVTLASGTHRFDFVARNTAGGRIVKTVQATVH
ncbi:MAG: hypothetical protein JWO13_2000 [Acidobacteriales bacterium]|nr:hypothetical protein [Terriglobales bacterium]